MQLPDEEQLLDFFEGEVVLDRSDMVRTCRRAYENGSELVLSFSTMLPSLEVSISNGDDVAVRYYSEHLTQMSLHSESQTIMLEFSYEDAVQRMTIWLAPRPSLNIVSFIT